MNLNVDRVLEILFALPFGVYRSADGARSKMLSVTAPHITGAPETRQHALANK
jgi:hypothetical protein